MTDILQALRSDDCINDFVGKLGFIESLRDHDDIHEDYFNSIEHILRPILQNAMSNIIQHTGDFLRGNEHGIRNGEVRADTVVKIVKEMPTCLKVGDFHVPGRPRDLIINQAVEVYPEIVPFLVKEGIKVNAGGDDKRGGLLIEDAPSHDHNVLQQLVHFSTKQFRRSAGQSISWLKHNISIHEAKCLETLKELRSMNLLVKDDIDEYDLMEISFNCDLRKKTFDYLVDWYPDGLKLNRKTNSTFFHRILDVDCRKFGIADPLSFVKFSRFLEASMRHYRDEAGLLFEEDADGTTICKKVLRLCGEEQDAFEVIAHHIPFDNPIIPILHHVASDAPNLMDAFISRYSSNTSQVDPKNGLYPFMTAAQGESKDHLSATYSLLRKDVLMVPVLDWVVEVQCMSAATIA